MNQYNENTQPMIFTYNMYVVYEIMRVADFRDVEKLAIVNKLCYAAYSKYIIMIKHAVRKIEKNVFLRIYADMTVLQPSRTNITHDEVIELSKYAIRSFGRKINGERYYNYDAMTYFKLKKFPYFTYEVLFCPSQRCNRNIYNKNSYSDYCCVYDIYLNGLITRNVTFKCTNCAIKRIEIISGGNIFKAVTFKKPVDYHNMLVILPQFMLPFNNRKIHIYCTNITSDAKCTLTLYQIDHAVYIFDQRVEIKNKIIKFSNGMFQRKYLFDKSNEYIG